MKIILDFDRTLFNTDAMLAAFRRDSVPHDVLVPEILANYPIEEYLYPDVLAFLRSKNTTDIFLLTALGNTYGDRILEYQRAKIEQEPLISLIHEVVYVEEEKGVRAAEIAAQFPPHEPIIFVDDRIEQCLSVKAALPQATCCLMVRDPAVIGEVDEVQGMPVVHSLSDVDAIIESL